MLFVQTYLSEAAQILKQIDVPTIEKLADILVLLRERGGRLFILGVGGGAGHASHAVNDFRKIVGIEAYTPTDNVSELTARINDDGLATSFSGWLEVSHLNADDVILVFSVGGGDVERNVSPNLVRALEFAVQAGATICGVVGRDGGYTARVANACLIVPTISLDRVTAHTESFQALIWHLLVSHPKLQRSTMKWEGLV